MNMLIPNEGKVYFNDTALGVSAAEDLVFRLYSNDYVPVNGSSAVNFTAATFTGSGAITLLTTDWAGAAVVANVGVNTSTNIPEWTHGGGASQVVYGWYALTSITGLVAMAQRFDNARNMTPGSIESLDPATFSLKTFA